MFYFSELPKLVKPSQYEAWKKVKSWYFQCWHCLGIILFLTECKQIFGYSSSEHPNKDAKVWSLIEMWKFFTLVLYNIVKSWSFLQKRCLANIMGFHLSSWRNSDLALIEKQDLKKWKLRILFFLCWQNLNGKKGKQVFSLTYLKGSPSIYFALNPWGICFGHFTLLQGLENSHFWSQFCLQGFVHKWRHDLRGRRSRILWRQY